MIKANELRIGNNIDIQVSNGSETINLTNVNITEISKRVRVNDIVFDYNDLRPIQITEEWLLKADFKNKGVHYCKDFGHNNLKIKLGVEIYGYLNFKYFNHIKYIHQLQNLYFALTGSELAFSTEP